MSLLIIAEYEIFESVVARPPGTVMDNLGAKEWTIQRLLHYQPMFQNITVAAYLRVVMSQN